MSERVVWSVEAGVADVRLNRPEKINACDPAMFEAIAGAIAALGDRSDVRAVVLSGEGRGFSVGVDLQALASSPALKNLQARTHGEANVFQQVAWGWRRLPVPVIAAVHGFALGAGFQIMLGADVRIVAPDAQLSLMEVRWGLVPDCGAFPLLRTLVRDDVARELTYTARRFSGEKAAALGLATRTAVDPRTEALALAREIAAQSPEAVRGAKRLINLSADATDAELLLAESVEQERMMRSPDLPETLAAAAEGRTPVFRDVGGAA